MNAKQNASTAITTSNIGKQSVNYATSSGNSAKFGGYVCDFDTENDSDTWMPVINNGKLQHRVIPKNIVSYWDDSYLNYVKSIRGGWEKNGSTRLVLDWVFDGSNCIRFSYDPKTKFFCIQKQVSGSWTTIGSIYLN